MGSFLIWMLILFLVFAGIVLFLRGVSLLSGAVILMVTWRTAGGGGASLGVVILIGILEVWL